MGQCPQCGGELGSGGSACTRCGFSAKSPVPDRGRGEDSLELVEVHRASNEMEAQLIRGLLESHSIPCTLRGEALRLTHSITVDGLAEVRVMVMPDDLDRAREIIASTELDGQAPTEQ